MKRKRETVNFNFFSDSLHVGQKQVNVTYIMPPGTSGFVRFNYKANYTDAGNLAPPPPSHAPRQGAEIYAECGSWNFASAHLCQEGSDYIVRFWRYITYFLSYNVINIRSHSHSDVY